MGMAPSTTILPVMPKRSPSRGPSVSTMTSLPLRRTACTFAPVSSRRRASVVVPRLANHSSGAWTQATVRPTVAEMALR